MDWLQHIHGSLSPEPSAAFGPGDEVRVWYRLQEQGKERLGQFQGLVIRLRGSGHAKTFTVRRVTHGEGVERVFPIDSRMISKVEVLRRGNVRRSRLYFLRTTVGKSRIALTEGAVAAGSSAAPAPVAAKPGEAGSSAADERSERAVSSVTPSP